MAYVSPGDAFSSGYNDYLMQQDQLKRQQANDARLAAHQANEDALAREALNEKRIMNQSALDEKEKKNLQAQVGAMQPGDIPPSELVAGAKRHGIPLKLQAPEMAPPPVPAGLAAEGETNTEPTSLAPQMSGEEVAAAKAPSVPAALSPSGMGPGTYAGSPGYLEAQRNKAAFKEQEDAASSAGEKAYYRALGASISPENPKGTPPSGSALKIMAGSDAAAKPDIPVMRLNPRTGKVEQVGSAPAGSHFMTEPTPKDTTAADLHRATLTNTIYQQGVADMKASRVLGEARQTTLDSLAEHLAMKNPTTDAVAVPELLKAMVSGTGSGFRMTTYEINKIENARSVWETIKANINKYAGDPEKARSITDSQRKMMTQMLVEARKSIQKRLDQANDIEGKMDDAAQRSDFDALHRLRTEFHKKMAEPNNVEKSLPGGEGRKTPEQLLKEVDDEMAAAAGKK